MKRIDILGIVAFAAMCGILAALAFQNVVKVRATAGMDDAEVLEAISEKYRNYEGYIELDAFLQDHRFEPTDKSGDDFVYGGLRGYTLRINESCREDVVHRGEKWAPGVSDRFYTCRVAYTYNRGRVRIPRTTFVSLPGWRIAEVYRAAYINATNENLFTAKGG